MVCLSFPPQNLWCVVWKIIIIKSNLKILMNSKQILMLQHIWDHHAAATDSLQITLQFYDIWDVEKRFPASRWRPNIHHMRARDWDFARYKLHSCNSCERAGPNVETVNDIIIHISQHRKQMADSSFDLCVFYAKCWTLSTAARRELLTTQTMAASLFV